MDLDSSPFLATFMILRNILISEPQVLHLNNGDKNTYSISSILKCLFPCILASPKTGYIRGHLTNFNWQLFFLSGT